jgi:LEA14-like dessication related protein
VEVTGLGLKGLNLSLQAVVYNPNGFGATVEAANYSVYANGHYVGEGQLAHKFDIAPQSSQILVFPVSAGWGSTFMTTGSYIVGLGNVTWKARGTANVDVGGISLYVTFELATS